MSKLTTAEFNTRKPGKYADGDNLHLIVSANGQRRFIYSPRVNGRRPEYGFTPEKALANFPKEGPLKAARLERDRLKGLLAQGIDPRTEKPLNAPDSGLAFKQVVLRFIKEQLTAYKPHTIAAWEYALTVNCKSIADKPLDDITVLRRFYYLFLPYRQEKPLTLSARLQQSLTMRQTTNFVTAIDVHQQKEKCFCQRLKASKNIMQH